MSEPKLSVMRVICERWIIVDEAGIRRSGWYQLPQWAEQDIPKVRAKLMRGESLHDGVEDVGPDDAPD